MLSLHLIYKETHTHNNNHKAKKAKTLVRLNNRRSSLFYLDGETSVNAQFVQDECQLKLHVYHHISLLIFVRLNTILSKFDFNLKLFKHLIQ